MSTIFDVLHQSATRSEASDRYPADARFDDASLAPTTEQLVDERDAKPHRDEEKAAAEKELDKALKDSFPASDPVSIANGTVAGSPDPATGKVARKAGSTNDKPPVD